MEYGKESKTCRHSSEDSGSEDRCAYPRVLAALSSATVGFHERDRCSRTGPKKSADVLQHIWKPRGGLGLGELKTLDGQRRAWEKRRQDIHKRVKCQWKS